MYKNQGLVKLKNVFLPHFLSLFLFFSACSSGGFKTADSGLRYKMIVENPNEQKPIQGDVLTLKFRYTDASGKTIEESSLFRTQLKKISHAGGCIEDALLMMHKGDSGIFKINAEKYYTKSRKQHLPENLNPDEELFFYIKLVNIKSIEEFKTERQMAYISDVREEDRLLKDFLKRTNVTVAPTPSGLYVITIKPGEGKTPEPGKKVQVHYLGYFIDGQIFDSSYERKKPFEFRYGMGEVIQGWDEALQYMKVGGKYKLIIPSHLAYGDQQHGPIPPNASLIFEIELLHAD